MKTETKIKLKAFFRRWLQCYSWPTKSDLLWAGKLPFNHGVFQLLTFCKSRPLGIIGWVNRFRNITIVMIGLTLLDSILVSIGLLGPIGQ